MKSRFVVLLILLGAVVSVTVWRILTPRKSTPIRAAAADVRPAPLFQLLDQHDRPIQLNGYLNRYPIVLTFFDASSGPDADPVLRTLKEFHPALKTAGIKIIAVSAPLTPEHKQTALSFPFPILRDTRAGQPDTACFVWGTATAEPDSVGPARVRAATFFIAADGTVAWKNDRPQPVEHPELLITQLIGGQR